MSDDRRKSFEEWVCSLGFEAHLQRDGDGSYYVNDIACWWTGWQASWNAHHTRQVDIDKVVREVKDSLRTKLHDSYSLAVELNSGNNRAAKDVFIYIVDHAMDDLITRLKAAAESVNAELVQDWFSFVNRNALSMLGPHDLAERLTKLFNAPDPTVNREVVLETIPDESWFLDRIKEMTSVEGRDFLLNNPPSLMAKFLRVKLILALVGANHG